MLFLQRSRSGLEIETKQPTVSCNCLFLYTVTFLEIADYTTASGAFWEGVCQQDITGREPGVTQC